MSRRRRTVTVSSHVTRNLATRLPEHLVSTLGNSPLAPGISGGEGAAAEQEFPVPSGALEQIWRGPSPRRFSQSTGARAKRLRMCLKHEHPSTMQLTTCLPSDRLGSFLRTLRLACLASAVGALLVCLGAGTAACGAEDPGALDVVVLGLDATPLEHVGAVQANPVDRKVYVGALVRDERRTGLFVYDLGPDGKVVGEPRRYSNHPDPLPAGHHSTIGCFHLDRARRKLTWGVHGSHPTHQRSLVTMSLDERGEPTGEPQAFDHGNPNKSCDALAPHPTLPRLYAVGWGGEGIFALDQDVQGLPLVPAKFFRTGSYGGAAVAIRADGKKLYRGTYPSTLEVCDLDAKGDVVGKPRALAIPGGKPEYLRFVATERAIFFRGPDGRLAWFTLDAQGEPNGAPQSADIPDLQGIALGAAPNRLLVAAASRFPDAVTKKSIVQGLELRELTVEADGRPGATIRASTPIGRAEAVSLAGGALPVVAAKSLGRGFLGNRLAGLEVRCTLVSLEVDGTPLPAAQTVKLGDEMSYLRFVVSDKHSRVYAAVDGQIVSFDPQRSPVELSRVPCGETTGVIALDPVRDMLYVGQKDGGVFARKLAATGVPLAEGTRLDTGVSPLGGLVVHASSGAVLALGTATTGAPVGAGVVRVDAGPHVADAALDDRRGRLYVVGAYHGRENTAIWKLRPDGSLAAPAPTRLADAIPVKDPAVRGTLYSVRLDAARRKLYVVGSQEQPPADAKAYVIVRDLDEQGDATGEPRRVASPNARASSWALDLSADGTALYESGWGEPKLFVRKIDARGDPTGDAMTWQVGGQGKRQLTVAAGGKLLLAGTYPSTLEVLRLNDATSPAPGAEAVVTVDALRKPLGLLAVGQTSAWVDLDEALTGGVGPAVVRCGLSGASVRRAVLRWEVAQRDGDSRRTLRTVDLTIAGNVAALIVPKYGLDDPATLTAQIRTSAEEFARYLAMARKYGLSPNERPQQFTVANGLIGIDSSVEALEAGSEVLGLLGHNTVQAWSWGGVAGATIRESAERHGLRRFRDAIYNPPSYFHYDVDAVRPESLDRWAAKFRESVATMGGKPAEIALLHMADEPGWYFPASTNDVRKSPERLAVFRDYLKSKGLSPRDLGAETWEQVLPGSPTAATTLAGKRLLYWTARFYPESLSLSFHQATASLQRQLHPQVLTTVNLNNWPGRFYIRSPGQKYANNADAGPDAAMGMPDWFDLGRKRAVSCIWTEDWFGDADSQLWSLYGDLLRSAAREGDLAYGGYAVGQSTGAMPAGSKYKILSLVGHGAKTIDPYTFGPHIAFADGWSDKEVSYRNLAAAMRLLAKGERLLAPGKPRAGSVAIVFPQASQVWDPTSAPNAYLQELYGLHAALIHDGFPVDFVDDFGVEAGDIARRKYAAVYVTAPNLSRKAQSQLIEWVRAGGTLVLAPGACAADEYDEPTAELRDLIGAQQADVPRIAPPHYSQAQRIERVPVAIVRDDGAESNRDAPFAISQVAPLRVAGGTALGEFASPAAEHARAAVVEMRVGRGRLLTFGYWPGVTYWLSSDRSRQDRLPSDWSASARRMATLGARVAQAARPVTTSVPGVEACWLESAEGVAIVLLNWTGRPLEKLRVDVRVEGAAFRKVASAELGELRVDRGEGGSLTTTLPLETVDVLLLDR